MAAEEKLRLVLAAVDRTAAPIRKVNRRIEAMTKPIRKVRNSLRSLARESGLPKLGQAFGRLGRTVSRFAIAGVAAMGAVGAAVIRTTNQGDEIAKFARQVGIGTDALQEYEFAADRSGVSVETFRQSVGALSKRVGELQAGRGALSTLLGDSNLARELKATTSTEEALRLVNEAIASIEDPTKKAALAAAAFSRAGLPMIRLANEGANGIADLREEAQRLGNILSGDQLRASEEFQDSITDLKAAAGGLVTQISAGLIPVLRPLVDSVTEFLVTNREVIQLRAGEAISRIADGARSFWAVLQRVIPPTLEFVERIGGLRTVAIILGGLLAATVVPAVVALGAAFASTAGLVTLAIAGIGAAASAIAANWDSIKDSVTGAIDSIITKARELIAKIPEPVRDLLSAAGGVVTTVAAATPIGLAASAASEFIAGGGTDANVGGRIEIELDDRRARVRNAETESPGVELDLAGGEALAY